MENEVKSMPKDFCGPYNTKKHFYWVILAVCWPEYRRLIILLAETVTGPISPIYGDFFCSVGPKMKMEGVMM